MNLHQSFDASLKSAWIIIKLVIPIYLLAQVLFYYNTLSYVAFLVEPFTSLLNLPKEASLAIISGIFLNLYAAVAFAAPLQMSSYEWSILAVFLGICHSMIVESAVMKKLGISYRFSYLLRFTTALVVGYLTTLLPKDLFNPAITSQDFEQAQYHSLAHLLHSSLYEAFFLSIKIIILITVLIFIMDYIKSSRFVQKSEKNISKSFSLVAGIVLGITYGAGILLREAKSGSLSKRDIFFLSTFLMICHAIIEDTLLFVIFGADFTLVVAIRTVAAVVITALLLFFYDRSSLQKL